MIAYGAVKWQNARNRVATSARASLRSLWQSTEACGCPSSECCRALEPPRHTSPPDDLSLILLRGSLDVAIAWPRDSGGLYLINKVKLVRRSPHGRHGAASTASTSRCCEDRKSCHIFWWWLICLFRRRPCRCWI